MKNLQTTHYLGLTLIVTAALLSSKIASATHPSAPGITTQGTSLPSGGGIDGQPIGGGGHYDGPGDIVPPCPGCPLPPSQCIMPLGDVCFANECLEVEWVPDYEVCKYPMFSSGGPVWTQGYMLTVGNIIEALQSGDACADEFGNITMCIESPFAVDEVHVFESGMINGYDPAPIDESVTATVCFDGEASIVGWAFNQVSYNYDCEFATVCVTFNADCMQGALMDWYAYGINMDSIWNQWLFYVDFVSCEPCEDTGVGVFIDAWQQGTYKGPGDVVPVD
ncbi:MAG: hypothetical protein H8E86_03790 [Planctomycetes bacterium]|nr:hypothetical protein [Planctomycetota bacterium]